MLVFIAQQALAQEFWQYWQHLQQNHMELRASEADRQALLAKKHASWGNLLPSISGNARYLKETEDYLDTQVLSAGSEYTLTAEQRLFDLKSWQQIKLAEKTVEREFFLIDQKIADLRYEVLKTYWQAILYSERVRIFKKVYQPLIERIQSQGQVALAESLRSRQDQAQWLLAFSQMQLQAIVIEDELSRLTDQLKLWGLLSDFQVPSRRLSFRPDKKWIGLPSQAEDAEAPLLKLAELTSEQAELTVSSKQADFWPRLSLFADWQHFQGRSELRSLIAGQAPDSAVPPRTQTLRYGVALQWSLFQGLQSHFEHSAAKAEREAAQLRQQGLQQQQTFRRNEQLRSLHSAVDRFNKVLQLREETQNWLLGVLKQQNAGLQSFDALLAPLTRAYEAESLYYDSLFDFFRLYWMSLRERGRLDEAALRIFADEAVGTSSE